MLKRYNKLPLLYKHRFKRTAYRPPYELCKIKWTFHLTDVDDLISIPHGDGIDIKNRKVQLNPYTKKVFFKKQEIGSLSKKEYIKLWNDMEFFKFVHRAREYYKNQHPNSLLPIIPKFGHSNRKKISLLAIRKSKKLTIKPSQTVDSYTINLEFIENSFRL